MQHAEIHKYKGISNYKLYSFLKLQLHGQIYFKYKDNSCQRSINITFERNFITEAFYLPSGIKVSHNSLLPNISALNKCFCFHASSGKRHPLPKRLLEHWVRGKGSGNHFHVMLFIF